MDVEYFRLLYDYSYWARDRLLATVGDMSEEDYARPNGFTYPSLRSVFAHALSAEVAYTNRWLGDTTTPRITEADVPNPEALRERWRLEEAKLRAYLNTLTDADLDTVMSGRTRAGDEFSRRLGHDMTQILNHGTQHRSEAAEMLTQVGRSPGDMDFAVYLQETGRR